MTADTTPTIGSRFVTLRDWLGRFPLSVLQLGMRVGVGFIFFNAGILKFQSFEFAVKLFQEEYKVPLLPPEVAARITMFNELTWPVFLFLGLASRFATLPLLGQLVVMEMTYPKAWNDHVFWGSVLLLILTRGARSILARLPDRAAFREAATCGLTASFPSDRANPMRVFSA